jgi:hypothetical protein
MGDEAVSAFNRLILGKRDWMCSCPHSVFAELSFIMESNKKQSFESPDFIVFGAGVIHIIEHFQFDCFPSSLKNGSTLERQKDVIDIELARQLDGSFQRGCSVYRSDKIKKTEGYRDNSPSYFNYFANFERNFNQHYKKIDKYKRNVKNKHSAATIGKVVFLIENTSPLGNYVYDEPLLTPREICPSLDTKIRDFYKSKDGVDYVIFCSDNYNGHVELLSHHDDEESSPSINHAAMKFIPIMPNVISSVVKISDSNCEGK